MPEGFIFSGALCWDVPEEQGDNFDALFGYPGRTMFAPTNALRRALQKGIAKHHGSAAPDRLRGKLSFFRGKMRKMGLRVKKQFFR